MAIPHRSERPGQRGALLDPGRARWLVAVVFIALVAAFAAALWATILRPPAYEVRGAIVARPAANMILVRHEAAPALGMSSMELMAVFSDPALLDDAKVGAGDRVRLAVRRKDEDLTLLRIEKLTD
jgi:Cu/Ag efflux protein CusF